MAEPWIDSPTMVGEWDPAARGWSALDWVPGPAGTAALLLPGDVEVDVDVAAPGLFVGLWAMANASGQAAPATIATVRTLLGDARARELLDRRSEQPRPLRSEPRGATRRRRVASDPPDGGVAPALARYALAVSIASEPGVPDLVRALALIDAALATRQLDGLGLVERGRVAAEQGVTMVLDLDGELDAVDSSALAAALQAVQPLLPSGLAGQVQPLTLAAEARIASFHAAEFAARAPAAPVGRLLPVDVGALPESLAVVEAAARATTPSEVEVRLSARPDLAERLWARAFDPDGTLVAAAPFLDVSGDAIARLLIPPATLRSAALDVVDRPGEPRQSAAIRAAVDAVEHGRSAARAERLDDRKESFARWSRSSAAWDEAGDADRAELARRYAEESGRGGRVPPPLLADAPLEQW